MKVKDWNYRRPGFVIEKGHSMKLCCCGGHNHKNVKRNLNHHSTRAKLNHRIERRFVRMMKVAA